jgi:polysaccharide export outer membrane protein
MKPMMYQTLRAVLAVGCLLAFFAAAANAGSLPAAGPTPVPAPVGRQYRINPGDQLSVQVYGEQNLPATVTVLPDGDIFYPLAGRVHVGGLTVVQATSALKTALGEYILHPVVSLSVTQQGQISVLVLGNVKTPGKYQLPAGGHATDAVAAAGGLGPVNGDYPIARVADANGNVQSVNLQKILHDGDISGNVLLTDEATVYVPSPNTFNVEVFGAVDKPGDVTLNEGDGLAMAIARAAPSTASNPDLNRVEIRRANPATGQVQTMTVDLYQTLQSRDLSKDTPMQKGDIVWVPQAKRSLSQQVSNGGFSGGVLLFLRSLFP